MTDRDALILGCLKSPLDAAPRLVLSDWLEEFGGWHGFPLAALRGDGCWKIHGGSKRVSFEFYAHFLAGQMYPFANMGLWIENASRISFDGIDGLPVCEECQTAGVLAHSRRGKWECNGECHYNSAYETLVRTARSGRLAVPMMVSMSMPMEPMQYTSPFRREATVVAGTPLLAGDYIVVGTDGRVAACPLDRAWMGMALESAAVGAQVRVQLF